jgi:hypothetical protein
VAVCAFAAKNGTLGFPEHAASEIFTRCSEALPPELPKCMVGGLHPTKKEWYSICCADCL